MILTLDLAFTKTGAAIFDNDNLIAIRLIKSIRSDKMPKRKNKDERIVLLPYTKCGNESVDDFYRAMQISRSLINIIERFDIDYVVFEMSLPSGAQQGKRAASTMGASRSIIATILECKGIDYCYVTPGEVKDAVCGRRSASKDEVIMGVKKLYPQFPFLPIKSEDVYDAVAVMEAYKRVRRIRGSNIDVVR